MARRKKFYNDSWMYEKPKCKSKNPRIIAEHDERPLPPLPSGWPTDKMSKVHIRPDGIRQLSHPQRDIYVLCEKRWMWVSPREFLERVPRR